MARELALTPFLAGDPVALGAEVSSLPSLAWELGLPSLEGAGVLGVGPRVALLHSLTGAVQGLAVRAVRLPHAPALTDTSGPVDAAIVLTSSLRESGAALHLVSRLTYIFASNVPELVPFLAFVFLGVPLPLTVMQILAVDLGTDLLPALALGAEPPEPGVMARPPRSPTDRLLSAGRLARAFGFLGVIEAALSLGAFFWTYRVAGWRPGLPLAASGDLYRRATTMTLAGIVATQVGNVFACRTDRESVFRVGLLANRLVLGGIAAELAILLALILLPPFPYVFGLAPLAFAEWGILLLFPPAVVLCEEGRKWVVRRTRPR
ncbi:MAG: cation transporting ATPase C-terminal domain-containing protein [Candidatus Rokubacteria bacterium]|nr:cation transporting ATPase C-terminal domain-containing protein [Candidatus Rokubacteria bacterium]